MIIYTAVMILIALIAVLWHRTHRLDRDLQATRQEVKIQRTIAMDELSASPCRRRRLHRLHSLAFVV